jgi:spore maturation protein CgeB
MKILVAAMKYDYGIPERGFSYEYYNIFMPLCENYGDENVLLFDFYSEYKQRGKELMNRKLEETVINYKPDICLFCLFENEFDEKIVSGLRNITKTVVYFFDDPWRKDFARHWRKYFDFFSTPDYYTYKTYQSEGLINAIYSPFGFNASIYRKMDLEKIYDVSFVGGFSPFRKWIINNLRKNNIDVKVFGRGWNGKENWISQEEMVKVFNQSKINLNLSNSISYDPAFLFYSLKSIKAIKQLLLLRKNKEQVKGRHFEINGCGGFQLSYFVPGLNLIYEIDKEIAVFENERNLKDEIKFFLKNDDLRNTIAENGYKRSRHDHSAQSYLTQLVNKIYNQTNE